MNSGKVSAPQSPEAEREVLGAVLVNPDIWTKVEAQVTAEDFYLKRHHVVYGVFKATFDRHRVIDMALLMETWKERPGFDNGEAMTTLNALLDRCGLASNVDHYCEILRSKSLARRVQRASWDLEELAVKSDVSDDERLGRVDSIIRTVYRESGVGGMVVVGEGIDRYFDQIQQKRDGDLGVKTGIYGIDSRLGTIDPGWLVAIIADAGVGKTAFAMQIAHQAATEGRIVGVASLEMSVEDLAGRLLALESGVPVHVQRKGNLGQEDTERVANARGRLCNLQIHIDDASQPSLGQICVRMRQLAQETGRLDLIVVDYLQLLQVGDGKDRIMSEEMNEITRSLKLLGQDLGAAVLILSQITSEGSRRGVVSHRDARGGQAIGANMDLAFAISETPDGHRIAATKSRHSPPFTLTHNEVRWNGANMRFEDR